uniref:DDE-type integrase/transposase/recombinase n=1 Tax=Acinetobacter indicus TaxID=756892 RepID=UPI00144403F4
RRLGHVSDRGLKELGKQGLFGKDKLDDLEFCENCIYGKSTRVKFTRSTEVTRETLSYVHSDLSGPSRTQTPGGGRYFITFIDDCSRKVWVYILKHKNEAFSKFKEWNKMVEIQTGRKVKKLRTDNGLEYLGDEFNQFIKEEGMVRHKIVRKTPEQNGLAERMNRTLLERVSYVVRGVHTEEVLGGSLL